MGDIATQFASVFRDHQTPGLPASGAWEPPKNEVRALGTTVESYVSEALAAVGIDGVWPTATANVPRGITGHGTITAGSGGTNGTFAFSVTGGNFSVDPTGTFTVSGGALTAITITGPGEYIGASPTAPTLVLSASAGLSGANAALTVGFLVASGRTWLANHASNTALWQVFQNDAGTATSLSGSTFVKQNSISYFANAVPQTDSATALVVTPSSVLPNNTGYGVAFRMRATVARGTGEVTGVTMVVNGVNDGSPIEMRDKGDARQVPQGAWAAGDWIEFTRNETSGRYEFLQAVKPSNSFFVPCLAVVGAGSGAAIHLDTQSPIPNETTYDAVFRFSPIAEHTEGGVTINFRAWSSEPLQMRTMANEQISPGTWAVGDIVEFTRSRETNFYELINVIKRSALIGAGTQGSFYAEANSRIYALNSFGK